MMADHRGRDPWHGVGSSEKITALRSFRSSNLSGQPSNYQHDGTDPYGRTWHAMKLRATTILTVRHKGKVAIGGDGQVTLGNSVMKADATKIRHLLEGKVITGFAGGSADAFALLERLEGKLKDFPGNVPRAATELAKEWRTDRALRRLEAMVILIDAQHTLLVTGIGDVIQPTDGILGIGSGGAYATAAARGLVAHSELDAAAIVRTSLEIASGIDIYTNMNIIVEQLESKS
jgi:ATP-dependent HslUV protease subunit HslV